MTPTEWATLIDKFGVSAAVMVALFVLGSIAIGAIWLAAIKVARWAGSRIDEAWEWHKGTWERLAASHEANEVAIRMHHDEALPRWSRVEEKLGDVHEDVKAIKLRVVK